MKIKLLHTKEFTNRFKPINQKEYPLTILEDLGIKNKVRKVTVECPICKDPYEVKLADIKRKASTKCRNCANRISSTTHGKSHTDLHGIWTAMKQRCYNKNTTAYKYYGAKGVTICNEWLNDFNSFYTWAISNDYIEGLTIDKDRLSKKLGIIPATYSPKTCEWATRQEQAEARGNKFSNNTTGYGNIVRDTKRNCWEVKFMYKGILYHVGRFKDIDSAVTARDKKRKEVIK